MIELNSKNNVLMECEYKYNLQDLSLIHISSEVPTRKSSWQSSSSPPR